jgi:hypothetical protein
MRKFFTEKNRISKIITGLLLFFIFLTGLAMPVTQAHSQTIQFGYMTPYTAGYGQYGSANTNVGTSGIFSSLKKAVEDGLFSFLENIVDICLTISSFILGVAGWILDKVVNMSIINMGNYTNKPFIRGSWAVIRDLLNIFFIFGLLYISIKTIVFNWGKDTKEMLGRLIMAALLINFSFFFTSLLIDVSNIVTLNIYEGMRGCIQGETSTLSGCWTTQLKTNTVMDASDTLSTGDGWKIIQVKLIGSIVLLVAAVVFFGIAMALLSRFISLIFILITSPAMFASWILPKLSPVTTKWTSKLQSSLLFAPLVFIFMYISYQMISSGNILLGSSSGFTTAILTPKTSPGSDTLNILIDFIIIIGFMVGSLVAAKTIGDSAAQSGSKWAGNLIGKGVGKAGNKAFGGLARNTVGRGSARLADNTKGTNRFSRALKTNLGKVGDASFDARNNKTFQGIASKTGITLGEGQKGGFRTAEKANIQGVEDARKNMSQMTLAEKQQRDQIKAKMRKDYDTEIKAIKESKEKVANLKDEQKKYSKDSNDYKKIEFRIQSEYKTINNNTQAIKDDTKNPDGNRNDDIKKIEKAGKEREKEYMKKLNEKIGRFSARYKKEAVAKINEGVKDDIKEIISREKQKSKDKSDDGDKDKS